LRYRVTINISVLPIVSLIALNPNPKIALLELNIELKSVYDSVVALLEYPSINKHRSFAIILLGVERKENTEDWTGKSLLSHIPLPFSVRKLVGACVWQAPRENEGEDEPFRDRRLRSSGTHPTT
jgi:hypothetical protein